MLDYNILIGTRRLEISHFIIIFLFTVNACPIFGQALSPESPVKIQGYNSAHIYWLNLSTNGNWATWNLHYESDADTLMVKNTENGIKYNLPKGTNGKFANSNKLFIYTTNDNQVKMLNLNNGHNEIIPEAYKFQLSKSGRYLALKIKSDKGYSLLIKDLEQNRNLRLSGIMQYANAFNPKKPWLVYTTEVNNKKSIKLLDLKKFESLKLIESKNSDYFNLSWSDDGKSLLFMEKVSYSQKEYYTNRLYKFSMHTTPKLMYLDAYKNSSFPVGHTISNRKPFLSENGNNVFFYLEKIQKKNNNSNPSKVEIWKGSDALIPVTKKHKNRSNGPWLATWDLKANSITPIGNPQYPEAVLTGNEENAVLYNNWEHEPQEKAAADIDLQIYSLKKKSVTPLVTNFKNKNGHLIISNNSDFIVYFKNKDWWVYNIAESSHKNLTAELNTTFIRDSTYYKSSRVAYGFGGWLTENNAILLYDEYDIWLIELDGSRKVKLTSGNQNKIQYRLSNVGLINRKSNLIKYSKPEYNLKKGLILKATGTLGRTGYLKWKKNKPLQKIVFGASYISAMKKLNKTGYLYIRETQNTPPQIIYKRKGSEEKKLYQSNETAAKLFKSKREIIEYPDQNGELLKGILMYPVHFDPSKKYPMIVQIYEKVSETFYKFKLPDKLKDNGISKRTFSQNGYFILLPDISYTTGNPGFSAVHCVKSAVNEALKYNFINKTKIGLAGHSFGGYETAFIISQTDMFAAAVASSGIMDLTSLYFSIDEYYTKKSTMWRFEDDQMRFEKPYFEIQKNYLNNSPIQHANKIKTPLLLWAGKKDLLVDYSQSLEMFLALRRLKKEVKMLLYEDEGHTLLNFENQINNEVQVKNWFDTYLK
ncbi:S9 family peptidase [Marixanthomonas ophiurae]|uniref:Peptidase S9 prolyl oligopeptidase catalytic domain-containing protein n=1 Tax=Marixanthomonas ophiurae TaxID=387659 RepID=A0A3E1QDY9_9FLAO|nr:prolyl oligopeptidase family serine peptidase [Marixanthomonas ophiurae]RFN60335.1 hypothetical protein DZ858_09930 [Marixanthomonas ophiurae]